MDTVDIKRFAFLSAVNGGVVVLALCMYVVFLNNVFPLIDLSILLKLEAGIVFAIQKLLGMPVEVQGSTLYYAPPSGQAFYVKLIPECAGVVEILIFVIMLTVFRGVGREAKIKGALIFVPLIFVENIARLAVLYPMSVWIGVDAMWGVHSIIWQYGQFAILLLLFGIWYLTLASPEIRGRLTHTPPLPHTSTNHPKGGKKIEKKP